MIAILAVIAPLFLIILLGAVLQRLKIADRYWQGVLNDFALYIGFPALIFAALTKGNLNLAEQSGLIWANSIFLVGSFILAYIIAKVLRLSSKNTRTLFITLGIGNVAYLGIPTLVELNGEGILPIASLIVAVYLFWMFTLGIGLLDYWQQKSKKHIVAKIFKDLVKNPLLIAVALGLIVNGLDIDIPRIIARSIDMMAASVTPVVLVVIGLFVGRSKFGELKKWTPVFAFTLMTLIVLPALFYYTVQAAGYSTQAFSASIIEAAMPLAITPFALADIYDLNKGFIARSIVLSTILAVVTIPFWTAIGFL